MRARAPDAESFVERAGVRIAYEVYGHGEPAIYLMPSFPIVHSRMWKAQVPYLARHFRVITSDPRGNGRSDRPSAPASYADAEFVADAFAVMDETSTPSAVLVGLCSGVRWAVEVANAAPERVLGIVAIAPGMPFLSPPHAVRARAMNSFEEVVDESEGWPAWENRAFWREHWSRWAEIHSGDAFMTPDPHSSKIREDLTAWALETSPETILALVDAEAEPPFPADAAEAEAMIRALRCPTMVIAGTEDRCQPLSRAERMAEIAGAELHVLQGAGHALFARYPVKVNLLIAEFVREIAATGQAVDALR